MRQIALMLLLFSMALTISGCSQKLVFVPTECNIGSIDKTAIDIKHNTDILSASKQCARNYTAIKEENEKLRAVIDACN